MYLTISYKYDIKYMSKHVFGFGNRTKNTDLNQKWQEFMHIETKVIVNGAIIAIIVRENAKTRLATKCFRGRLIEKAGNFRHWENAEEVFGHDSIRAKFTEQVSAHVLGGNVNPAVLSIDCSDPIGWESTIPITSVELGGMEEFSINTHAKGLRVLPGKLPSPKTNILTVICEARHETVNNKSQCTVVIHSMYPGVYIGKLDGDVSTREGRAFFDWEHPGEPW